MSLIPECASWELYAIVALWCWMLREVFPISSRGWKASRKGKVHDTISPFVPFSSKNLMRITSTMRFPSNLFLKKIQRHDNDASTFPGHIAFTIKTCLLDKRIRKEKRSLIMSATRVTPGDCNSERTCTYTQIFEVKRSRSFVVNDFISI